MRAIDEESVRPNTPLPPAFGVALDERIVEYPWLFSRLRAVGELGKVLDAGSTLNHEYILNRAPLAKANLTLMTLAPEKRCYWYKNYSYVFGDFRTSPFRDELFDTLICISTLEHVGLDNTLLYTTDRSKAENDRFGFSEAVSEFKRIVRRGGRCFITVPYGQHQDFGWFQLFDARMLEQLINAFGPLSYEVEFFKYSRLGWERASQLEVEDATAFDPHSGRGRADDRAGCARAIACIQMIK
ncbi:methyltransferase domain-containing protein [Bradyrhizobium diazoefficiens]|nr:methyltransferase domain-containing protein [Bradyrhizobium diazoefficiens]MBR0779033.1 methyltransferase domain-containing protein [Bradyrhizobium diazoefficiens]